MFKSVVLAVLISLFASLTAFAGEPAKSCGTDASNHTTQEKWGHLLHEVTATSPIANGNHIFYIGHNGNSGDVSTHPNIERIRDAREKCIAYRLENGKLSKEFVAKIDRFKLVDGVSTYITLHTTTALPTNRNYFERSKSKDAPAIVRELLDVRGVTGVRVVDAYTLDIYHGTLFEKEELMYAVCFNLKVRNW